MAKKAHVERPAVRNRRNLTAYLETAGREFHVEDAASVDLWRSIDDVFSVPTYRHLYAEWQNALREFGPVIVVAPAQLSDDDRDVLPRAIHDGLLRAKGEPAPIRSGDITVIFGHGQLIESVGSLRKDELRAILVGLISFTFTFRPMKEISRGRVESVQDILELTLKWSSEDRRKLIGELERQDGSSTSNETETQAKDSSDSGLGGARFSGAIRVTSKEIIERLKGDYGLSQQRIADEISASKSQISDIVHENSTPNELVLLGLHDLWSRTIDAAEDSDIPERRLGRKNREDAIASPTQVSSAEEGDEALIPVKKSPDAKKIVEALQENHNMSLRAIARAVRTSHTTIKRIFHGHTRTPQKDVSEKLASLLAKKNSESRQIRLER